MIRIIMERDGGFVGYPIQETKARFGCVNSYKFGYAQNLLSEQEISAELFRDYTK